MKKLLIMVIVLLLFPVLAYALDVTLSWDANTEDDLGGYKVYYNTSETPGPPYDGTGATEGDSPVIMVLVDDEDPAPEKVQITLHNLPDSVTVTLRDRFAVTATNIFNLESGYSNEVSVGVPTDPGNLGVAPAP